MNYYTEAMERIVGRKGRAMNQGARDENELSAQLAQVKRDKEVLASLKRIERLLEKIAQNVPNNG